MFDPVPHSIRFLAIVVLVSIGGRTLSAQPIPRLRIEQNRNIIFPQARPVPTNSPKMLAPVVPPPPPMPTRVPLDPARLDKLISELESGEFKARVNATRELKQRGGTSTVARMVDALLSDQEIERIAREQYGFVRPGEIGYVVITPEPTESVEVPEPVAATPDEPGFFERIWRFLTGDDLAADG